jgi:V8-like Glu-specific endopeptidase
MEVTSLAENLFFTTVRIDTVDHQNNAGSGTGFLFQHSYKDNNYPFIVTNKHVISGAIKGGITFIKSDGDKPKLGDAFRIDYNGFENNWIGNSDDNIDIAVMPLAPVQKYIMDNHNFSVFYRTIGTENVPTQEQVTELDALEEIIFVGYPNGIWDKVNYTPIMRKGTTATPIALDFENEKKFLIDASVFGGSSGSPVFIYNAGSYARKGGGLVAGSRFFFVGVVAAVYFKTSVNEIISLPIPTDQNDVAVDKEMIDLGVVFKAETVTQTIEQAIDKLNA